MSLTDLNEKLNPKKKEKDRIDPEAQLEDKSVPYVKLQLSKKLKNSDVADNAGIKEAKLSLDTFSVVRASLDVAQSIVKDTYVTVIYKDVEKDRLGEYDEETGIFTATKAGDYGIHASFLWDSVAWASDDVARLIIMFNDTTQIGHHRKQHGSVYTSYEYAHAFTVYPMAAGDTLRIQAKQESSATKSLYAGENYNNLSIFRIR